MGIIRAFEKFSRAFALLTALIGLTALAGWLLDIPALKSVLPQFVAMKANTALCFFLIGLSLWLLQEDRLSGPASLRLGRLCAALVVLTGVLTLAEYFWKLDLGIDQLLFKEPAGALLTSAPGRMAFNTAILFVCAGTSLVLLNLGSLAACYLAQWLALFTGLGAILSIAGYLYGAPPLYLGEYYSTAMAVHTTAAFLLAATGCLFSRPATGLMAVISSDTVGGHIARRLLPAVILIPFLLGGFDLYAGHNGFISNDFGVTLVALLSVLAFGVIVYLLALQINIAERKRKLAEKTIENNLHMLDTVGEMSRTGGWDLDVPALRLSWSLETRRIHEVADDFEPKVETAIGFYAPEDQPVITAAVKAALEKGEPFNLDLSVITAKGNRVAVHALGRPELREGKTVRLWGTFQDITERKRAEAALLNLNRELAEKKHDMENFLYITTHDLRGPLVNIQGFSRDLAGQLEEVAAALEQARLPEEIKKRALKLAAGDIPESLGYITGSAAKMNRLIDALLKMSHLGRMELRTEPVDMDAALKIVLASLTHQLGDAGGTIKVEPLPPCVADTGLVGQLFSNLLDNAIKYRDRGRKLEVTVKGEWKAGGQVLYTVSDNGLGIKESDLEKIWQIFYRGHAQNPAVEKGEGVGLAMVRSMVERNGGRIRV